MSGSSAAGGGIEFSNGDEFIRSEWLGGIPLATSWILAGLVLGLVFGVGALVAGVGVRWRTRISRPQR